MKFGIRYRIIALIMSLALLLGMLFVISSLVKLRTDMKKTDVFRQHEAAVIGRFLDTFFDRQEDFSSDSYAQQLIDKIKSSDVNVKRLSIHAKAPIGKSPSGYWFLASTKREKIGLPSDPEDLEALQSGQDIYLAEASSEKIKEGEHTLDLTSPIRDLNDNIIGVAGITVLYEIYADDEPEHHFNHSKGVAKAIANTLDAAISSEKLLSSDNIAQTKIEEIVRVAPYISRLSIHARAPEGKSPSDYWFLASTARERVGLPSDPEDVESIIKDQQKILFEEDATGNRFIDVTYPLHDADGKALATAGITIDLGAEDIFLSIARQEDVREMILFLLGILVIGVIFSLLFSAYFSRLITRPIKEYVEAAKDIAQGNLARKVDIDSQDEIGDFAEVFNDMAQSLKKMHDNLEKRVEERTRELSLSNVKLTHEIGERTKVEKFLRDSEEQYRSLFENATDIIQVVRPDGQILYVNPSWCSALGYTEEESHDLKIFDLIHPDCSYTCESIFSKTLENGSSGLIETAFKSKSGEKIVLSGSANCKYLNGEPSLVQCIFQNITERQKMEEELTKMKKIESVGVLAGGIAHDFNNILTAIVGNLTLARMYLEPGGKVYKRVEEAEKASFRAKALTQQLLTFSKGGEPIKTITSFSEIIKESCDFALRGSNVRCVFNFPENLYLIEADKGQISQVIHNLVINADQAMPEGGTINIQAQNIHCNAEEEQSLKAGNYVLITLADQGVGISEKHIEKIFDPYFSTKQQGHGLGLATAYSIIKKHDGLLRVESKQGEGSVFSLYLPASMDKDASQGSDRGNIYSGKGSVLLMDDEEEVRAIGRDILNHLGYQVATAINGDQVLEMYVSAQQKKMPFDVVILDLTIPGGLGGKETIEKLIAIDPGILAIVSSGYASDPIMSNYKQYGFAAVMPKPYEIGELSKVLKKLLQPH